MNDEIKVSCNGTILIMVPPIIQTANIGNAIIGVPVIFTIMAITITVAIPIINSLVYINPIFDVPVGS